MIVFQNRRLHAIVAYCFHVVGGVSFQINHDRKHTLLSKHDRKNTNDKGVQGPFSISVLELNSKNLISLLAKIISFSVSVLATRS